jgi:hypothetical protein
MSTIEILSKIKSAVDFSRRNSHLRCPTTRTKTLANRFGRGYSFSSSFVSLYFLKPIADVAMGIFQEGYFFWIIFNHRS